jgi:hypothetical protein
MKQGCWWIACLLAAPAAGQAAQGSGKATAQVVSDVLGAECAPLSFGTVISTRSTGRIRIGTDNARNVTGKLNVSPGGFSRGVCEMRGAPGRPYIASAPQRVDFTVIPQGPIRPGLETTLSGRLFSLSSASTGRSARGQLDAQGRDALYVGGTLFVPNNAHPGLYQGVVPVTVNY